MTRRTRPLEPGDAESLAPLAAANRAFMAPYDAVRSDAFYTLPGQVEEVRLQRERRASGTAEPRVVVDDDGAVVGRITLQGIVRGPFQSCSVGYWVAEAAGGRGYAVEAVGEVLRVAFDDLGLHRVQAETLVDNARSQRVLARNGFTPIGLAPGFLRIAGAWRDHLLFQRLADG